MQIISDRDFWNSSSMWLSTDPSSKFVQNFPFVVWFEALLTKLCFFGCLNICDGIFLKFTTISFHFIQTWFPACLFVFTIIFIQVIRRYEKEFGIRNYQFTVGKVDFIAIDAQTLDGKQGSGWCLCITHVFCFFP
jgi:hypothetical protein